MKVAFQKWGNSLALRVPKAFADEIGASEGRAANMSVSNGRLVVEVEQKRRKYTLDQLLKGMTKDNVPDEIDWGRPRGNEIW